MVLVGYFNNCLVFVCFAIETEKLGWFIHKPALSCKEILDKEGPGPDGEYYIDPGSGVTLPVFCDMTHEGGGWLLTMNLTYQTGRNGFTNYPTYSGISKFRDGYMGISSPALGELHSLINFTQLRFHCQKKLTRTLHIITTQDDKGTAVIDYFTAKTANLPTSCGSFTRGADDNSMLAIGCGQWGAGKWGHENRKTEALRMYDYAMYIPLKYHWIANGGYCDDTSSSSSDGDFWFIYVR
ncbi:predicted protein [Nematostella vectensis]|uniref:Fibrinogen C-terminal domain-containing protein n=1 Tax=Nematostella vectensis TaxID=45351 RepID=A7SS53_NEMVE|nr:predicted protein [Nematostella vectensis]|eukprot:XP_001625554.1 predicted protein [Nematostella vectensis]